MYKDCRTEQSAVRQRVLEKGLLEAMRSQRFEDISISDLCDRMGIPRKSFYRYFSGKEGALHALLDHTLMEFEPYTLEFQKGSPRKVQRDLESFFCFWLERRELLDALQRSNLSGMLIERAISYALTDEVLPSRFLPSDTREMQKQITMFAVCGLMSMVLSWHYESFQSPVPHLAEVAARMLGQPLFPGVERFL